ncbi:MAG: hypothetical protein IJ668_00180 [Selenomonadaceae bacterium]|nr:hypothetical protein [Selenomonadaceae bacterium]
MRRAEYEAGLYAALKARTALTRLLHDGERSIYRNKAPAETYERCPFVVYRVTSDNASVTADDREWSSVLQIRLHVVTADGDYDAIEDQLRELMRERGAARLKAMLYEEDGRQILISDHVAMIYRGDDDEEIS